MGAQTKENLKPPPRTQMNKGLIDPQFIQDLLARVDIVDLIGSLVDLKKAGRNYTGLCPFHDEKTPSFSVNSDKQFYHCFGCGASGDAIKFLQEYRNMNFVESVEHLATSLGIEVIREDKGLRPSLSASQVAAKKSRELRVFELLSATCDFYKEAFYADRFIGVRNYWKNRGFNYEVAKNFDLGFAEGKGLVNYLEQKGFSFAEIEEQGLASKTERGHIKEKFWQRLIFPIKNAKGDILGFGGRVIENDRMPKYLNSPETSVFDKSKILYGLYQLKNKPKKIESILITEGYLDVIALAQAGIDYSLATMGTSISQFHISELLRLSKNLVFCFDGDKAGFKAAQRALLAVLPFLQKLEDVRFLILEAGEDPDSLLKKEGKELFEVRIKKAIPLVEFFLEFIGAYSMDSSLDAKIKLVNTSVEYLAQLPQGIYATDFIINKVADLAETSIAAIHTEIKKHLELQVHKKRFSQKASKNRLALKGKEEQKSAKIALDSASEINPSTSLDTYAEERFAAPLENKKLEAELYYLLEVLLQEPSLAKDLDENLLKATKGFYSKVLSGLKSMAQKSTGLTRSDLLAYWYGTEIGDLLVKVLQNRVALADVSEQFNKTQAKILVNIQMEKIQLEKISQDANEQERTNNFLNQINQLKKLKS